MTKSAVAMTKNNEKQAAAAATATTNNKGPPPPQPHPFLDEGKRFESRWSGKQMSISYYPQNYNCDKGYFSKFTYPSPNPYDDDDDLPIATKKESSLPPPAAVLETKQQQSDDKKDTALVVRGTFSHGGKVGSRDEFTKTRAMERFRDKIKRETQMMDRHRDPQREKEFLEEIQRKNNDASRRPPCDKFGNPLQQPEFLFDVVNGTGTTGGGSSTSRTSAALSLSSYTPQTKRDCFYQIPKHAPVDRNLVVTLSDKDNSNHHRRLLSTQKTQNQLYGEQTWNQIYRAPKHGLSNVTQKFYDHGHL